MRIRQMVLTDELDTCASPDALVDENDNSSAICRICLQGVEDSEDPLVCPCSCKGSISSIHLECLKIWIQKKGRCAPRGSRFVTNYVQTHRCLSCEICHTPYPLCITVKGKRVPLGRVSAMRAPFIVLETLFGEPELHSLSLADTNMLTLGRGIDCNVVIINASVSRLHATISIVDGKFVLADNNSKYGTLVCIRRPMRSFLSDGQSVSIQSERTLFQFNPLPTN